MRAAKFIVGIGGLILITAGCELGNQPVYYGGDVLLQEDFNSYDDYEQPEGWEFEDDPEASNGPSDWYVYNTYDGIYEQSLYQYSGIWGGGYNNVTYFGTTALSGDESWTDYSVEVEFFTSCNDGVGIDIRRTNRQSMDGGFYRLMFMYDVNNGGPFIKLLYHNYAMGSSEALAVRNDISYDPSSWNSVKITCIGSRITCELNSRQIFDVSDSRLNHGRIGLFCFQMMGIYFDNVLVTALDEGTPTDGNNLVD